MTRAAPIRFGVVGLDHRHVFHLIAGLLDAGATCAGYWTGTEDERVLAGVRERFPSLPAIGSHAALLDDPAIDLIVCAAVPVKRAGIAIDAMQRGKDVLLDKPGVVTLAQLAEVRQVAAATGRRFMVCYSERLIVPAVQVAQAMVAQGAIGDVIQTVGLGPHRLNRAIRPPWFFQPDRYGGILVDIASHQIDQFLVLTGSLDAEIVHSDVGHHGTTTASDFEDFGEIVLRSGQRRGYVRVDWFTPDGLPTWGDGRLVVLGTHGTIEVRKYLDIAGRSGTDHLFIADQQGTRHIDCSQVPLTFFHRVVADVREGTETAIPQEHVFTVSRLSIEAQLAATRKVP